MSGFICPAAALAVRVALAVLALLISDAAILAAPTTIVDNGDPANRVDIVFLGDGYTQANLNAGIYSQHVQSYLNYMFGSGYLADPFGRYRNFFNVHRIDVVSNQSGADIPSQGIYRDTALGATYDTWGIDRLLTISEYAAYVVYSQAVSGTGITADMPLVTVNHSKYGGSGGGWAVFAGANSSAREIALHELAHSFSGLADEYVSYSEPWPGGEPMAPNVTTDPTGAKWSHWLGFDDPRGANLDIGVYQGAEYYSTGVYRPSSDSKMRSLNRAFDAVSRETLIHDIYDHVDPLDNWLDNADPLTDQDLWVDVVDPAVISVQWFVNDVRVEGATGEAFDLADYGYGRGVYSVRAHAYDSVIDYAFSGSLLDLVRTEFDLLEQDISWTVTIAIPEASTAALALVGMLTCGGCLVSAGRRVRRQHRAIRTIGFADERGRPGQVAQARRSECGHEANR